MKLLFLDTETTGFHEPHIVELAYGIGGRSSIVQAYFKPPKPISPQALGVHGISEAMLGNCKSFTDSAEKTTLQELLNDYVMVAHNAAFDARVLAQEGVKIHQSLCTVELFRDYYPMESSHKLQSLKESFKILVPGNAHSAIADVFLLKELFTNMLKSLVKDRGQEKAKEYIQNFIHKNDYS